MKCADPIFYEQYIWTKEYALRFYDKNFSYPSFLNTKTFICALKINGAWSVDENSKDLGPVRNLK